MRKLLALGATATLAAVIAVPAAAQTTGTRIVDRDMIIVIGAMDDPENTLPVDENADLDLPEMPVVYEEEPSKD